MLRSCVTQLLVVLVVICPYFCLGEAAEVPGAQSVSSTCCCKRGPTDGDHESPHPQDRDESDCLCHGAIADGVKVEAAECDTELFVTDLLDLSSDVVRSQPSYDLLLGVCHFPPFSTGRDVCALTCALLL